MRAKYFTTEKQLGNFIHPVILAQPMQHTDGFTLIGFDSWEDVTDEKFCAAVTNIAEFHITKDKIGFHEDES